MPVMGEASPSFDRQSIAGLLGYKKSFSPGVILELKEKLEEDTLNIA